MAFNIQKKLAYTEFALSNNQSSLADVTGFLLSSITPNNNAIACDYSISRSQTNGYAIGAVDQTVSDSYNAGSSLSNFPGTSYIGQQSSGKLICIGNGQGNAVSNGLAGSVATNSMNAIIRLNLDYTTDQTFSRPGGVAKSGFNTTTNCLKVQSDDKLLVTGTFTTFNGVTLPGSGGFVRLNADGSLDTAFNTNLGTGFNGASTYVCLQNDGKIIVSGLFTTFNGNTRNRIVRLNSDGTEDTTFATNMGTGLNINLVCIGTDPSGNIYGVGSTNLTTVNGNTVGKICRWDSTGTYDTTWNTNVGTTGFNSTPAGFILQTDGKCVVYGSFSSYQGNSRRLVRLNSDGTEDTTFNTNLGTGFNSNTSLTLYFPSTGMLLISGNFTTFNSVTANHIVFLNSDGTANTSMNTAIGTGISGSAATGYINAAGNILLGASSGLVANGVTVNGLALIYMTAADLKISGTGRFYAIYRPQWGTWIMNNIYTYFGQACGISFFMTSATGQLQYTSTNLPGTQSDAKLRYVITAM